jgi:hypothetical protein
MFFRLLRIPIIGNELYKTSMSTCIKRISNFQIYFLSLKYELRGKKSDRIYMDS